MNQSINLNLIPDGVKPVAKVSQFDVGRVVTFSLYQGPDVYTPPAGTTLEFRELKSDKHICVYDDAATLSDSTITLETTQQMTASAGEALCQFKLTNGTEVLATLNFWLDVQTDPAAEGDISDSDIPGIIALATEQMERAEAAADSAAADAESAEDSKEDAETAATSAGTSATAAEDSAGDAEAYAIGTRGGTDVPSTDPAYQNNSKYYSDLASAWAAHPPYVGANGDWYVYDPTTQQFVDTGIDASITMEIQDVTMLSYGSTPTVTNSGTSTDAVFHLGIPRAATIASVQKTSTSGLVDTYTMTLQDGTTFTYTVTNGADGQGSVSSVNNIQPVGGNVTLGLGDLNGVDLSTLSDGDVLVYDLEAGKWTNGGAVGGGHTIENPSGTAMAQRSNLQFKGNGVTVTDDSANNTTVVEITGGGTTIVQKPTVTVGTYAYNGTAQGPTITWATGMEDNCVVTNATKTDAGSYMLTIALKNTAKMVWNDMTTADITANYTINKATVTVPTVTDTSLTYNGSAQHPTVTGYDDTLMTRTGYEYTDAGSYTLVFSLIDTDNYEWSGTASFAWEIAKATGTVTLSKNSISLSGSTTSDTVAISNATGEISISSSDTTIATVSPSTMTASGGTLTVTSPNKKSGTATITVSVAATSNYAAIDKTISFNASYVVYIYGAQWDGTATTAWTRTDSAASFTDPNPYYAGMSGTPSSPFDNISPWKDLTKIEDSTGGTLVKIPKFYYKITQSGSGMKIQVASNQFDGASVCPACMDRGDGKGERDEIYIGRYHCVSTYKSTTGEKPKVQITRSTARTNIHNLGSTYWQFDFATRFTIWLLYIVEFANWNSQTKIGYGCSPTNSRGNVGGTDSMSYHTGTTAANRTTYGWTQYRNIEGLWDEVYDWLDGIYYNSNGVYVILNPNNFSDTSGGVNIGAIPQRQGQDVFPSALSVKNVSNSFQTFIPSAMGGSDSTYTCDAWFYDGPNYPCAYSGNHYAQNLQSGLFYIGVYSTAYNHTNVGCRLIKLP